MADNLGVAGALRARVTAGSMHCTHAYWVVEFTMRYDVVFLNLQTELEGEQYTVGKLMELPSSRCHHHSV